MDDTTITNGGVLIQVMDNDDATNGGMMSPSDEANTNGANTVNVTLTDDAIWQVTDTSMITSLNLSDSARVIIPEGVTLTVGGTEYSDCTLTADSIG